ncbi:MAG: hypothetical protein ACE366_04185 [Bradymonadia bacterium]
MVFSFLKKHAAAFVMTSALALPACDAPDFEVQAPLFVFNTYPANGSTVSRIDLDEFLIVFSRDLGTAEDVRDSIETWLRLSDEESELVLIRPDQTNVSYDAEFYTVRVLVDGPLKSGMAGGLYTLTVDPGLESVDGIRMPQPFSVRFRLAD